MVVTGFLHSAGYLHKKHLNCFVVIFYFIAEVLNWSSLVPLMKPIGAETVLLTSPVVVLICYIGDLAMLRHTRFFD